MSAALPDVPAGHDTRAPLWPACALGFAIGGFFDGILLHQVLQWHHLLSGIRSSAFTDIRAQILADGLFHLLMYVIGGIGLVVLYRARPRLALPGAGRALLSAALIGFGAWHVLDAVVSHWLTGIHRIRMDSEVPLLWDLGWLVVFGIVPLAVGWTMRRPGGTGSDGSGRAAASLLALIVLAAAPVAALPPRDITGAVVLFRPGMSQAEMMAAVRSAGGRLVWTDASGDLWALDFDDPADARKLYGRGALLVSNSLFAGCLAWSRTA